MSNPPQRILLIGAGPLPAAAGDAARSAAAPGVANRLWHFAQPLIAAGHDCVLITIEPQPPDARVPRLDALRRCETSGRPWRHAAVPIEACMGTPPPLLTLATEFAPTLLIGAGTLAAGATACKLAEGLCAAPASFAQGAAPPPRVWADLFGDPLAELAAKAEWLPAGLPPEQHLHAISLLWRVLTRADAFSTVSRRQIDGLRAQLLLTGRPADALPITCLPCCLEALPAPASPHAFDRAAWLAAQSLPAEARIALWSGGFNAWADPATLVGAAERALAADPRLWLVATGGELPGYLDAVWLEFQRLVAASPQRARMRAPGWLPLAEAGQWLRAADLGLVVDRPCSETRFGARNRLLYIAGADCPVLATRGCEAVADMEAAGALRAVEPSDADALAAAWLALMQGPSPTLPRDPREALAMIPRAQTTPSQLAIAAREYCTRHYTFAATATPLLDWAARGGTSASTSPMVPPTPPPSAVEDYLRDLYDMGLRERERAALATQRAHPLRRIAARAWRKLSGR